MKIIKSIAPRVLLLCGLLFLSNAHASTVTTFNDNWIDWPGYTSTRGDEHGNPKLDKLRVTVGDDNILEKVELLWRPGSGTFTRIKFDSLFINSYDITTTNTEWDDWDYFIHDGGTEHTYTEGTPLIDIVDGNVPEDGLWEVKNNYQYTIAKDSRLRQGNPNGIDADSLQNRQEMASKITWDSANGILSYDLSTFDILVENGLFVAYSPYCANDLIGGSVNPVPIPAAGWLFLSGILGLMGIRKKTSAT